MNIEYSKLYCDISMSIFCKISLSFLFFSSVIVYFSIFLCIILLIFIGPSFRNHLIPCFLIENYILEQIRDARELTLGKVIDFFVVFQWR